MAVCDLDASRVEAGKVLINGIYSKQQGKSWNGVLGYSNYHDLLANSDIDLRVKCCQVDQQTCRPSVIEGQPQDTAALRRDQLHRATVT